MENAPLGATRGTAPDVGPGAASQRMLDHHGDRQRMHRGGRSAWLRAAVLGVNDGIVSTASLIMGVAASSASRTSIMVAGMAGLAAGALSMAAGEYVSVSSQRDTERADAAVEALHIENNPELELEELAGIYRGRGLDRDLAAQVAAQLMAVDPLGSHLRDELGMTERGSARPAQAAVVSAMCFVFGSVGPVLVAGVVPKSMRLTLIAVTAVLLLALTGAVAGRLGGASSRKAAVRVLVGGIIAMGVTALIGRVVGVAFD